MKQKDIFLSSEGDKWFARNQFAVAERKLPVDDPLLLELLDCLPWEGKILEIGCGDGTRLAWIKNNLNLDCYGIDPSAKAIEVACSKGINAQQCTAEVLPFDTNTFNL